MFSKIINVAKSFNFGLWTWRRTLVFKLKKLANKTEKMRLITW